MIIETRILSCKECIFNYFWNLIISNVCSFFSTVFIEEIPVLSRNFVDKGLTSLALSNFGASFTITKKAETPATRPTIPRSRQPIRNFLKRSLFLWFFFFMCFSLDFSHDFVLYENDNYLTLYFLLPFILSQKSKKSLSDDSITKNKPCLVHGYSQSEGDNRMIIRIHALLFLLS